VVKEVGREAKKNVPAREVKEGGRHLHENVREVSEENLVRHEKGREVKGKDPGLHEKDRDQTAGEGVQNVIAALQEDKDSVAHREDIRVAMSATKSQKAEKYLLETWHLM